jgi:hypothetical protein
MTTFLTSSQVPQSKLQLKKAILKGTIEVFENNNNFDSVYRKVTDINCLLELWNGFYYRPKTQNQNNIAWACLGTSYYYKFANA